MRVGDACLGGGMTRCIIIRRTPLWFNEYYNYIGIYLINIIIRYVLYADKIIMITRFPRYIILAYVYWCINIGVVYRSDDCIILFWTTVGLHLYLDDICNVARGK